MKKYKTLITGKNSLIVDDIFTHLSDVLLALTCSNRFDDMIRHIEIFRPDIFLICLQGESRTDLARYAELKRRLTRTDIPTMVIGTEEECGQFEKIAIQMADQIMLRPVSTEQIQTAVIKLMQQVEQEKEELEALRRRAEEQRAQEERERNAPVDEKKHILIVDDDPLMLKLIKEYLGDTYQVATAVSGKIAHKYLETRHADLILLDYEMPVENGPEVLRKIRANDRLADIPVVFLTGITDREKIRQALIYKPQGYLIKPVDREKLLGTVERFIG